MHYYLLVLTLKARQNSGLEQRWMDRTYWILRTLAGFTVYGFEMAVLRFMLALCCCFFYVFGVFFVTKINSIVERSMECSRPKVMQNFTEALPYCTLSNMLVPDLSFTKKVNKCLNVLVALRCEQMRLRLSIEIETLQNKNIWGLAFMQALDSRDGPGSCFAFALCRFKLFLHMSIGNWCVLFKLWFFFILKMPTWHLISHCAGCLIPLIIAMSRVTCTPCGR